jgi:hypothetical protein
MRALGSWLLGGARAREKDPEPGEPCRSEAKKSQVLTRRAADSQEALAATARPAKARPPLF